MSKIKQNNAKLHIKTNRCRTAQSLVQREVKVNITSSISIKLTEWNMTILPEVSAIISQNLIYHSIVREGFGLTQ